MRNIIIGMFVGALCMSIGIWIGKIMTLNDLIIIN